MDNFYTTTEINALLERARKMLYIYKILGATVIACTVLGALLGFEIGKGSNPIFPTIGILLTLVLDYHILAARTWMRKEYKEFITESGIIAKMERINRMREQMEAQGKDFMSSIAPE